MPRLRRNDDIDQTDLLRKLNEGLRNQIGAPNLYKYAPHKKQRVFHTADEHIRLYIGGNRSGKTTGGVVEDIFLAMGRSPFRPVVPAPTRGRVCVVDFKQGLNQIVLPVFAQWLPPSFLIKGSWEQSYDAGAHELTLANGSTVEFMSYEQDLEKFAGTSRHWLHCDEEPPQHIWNECMARLIDTDGHAHITMTPIEGMTWIHSDMYKPGMDGKDEDIKVIQVEMLDNPYISPAAAERYLKTLTPEERMAREKGAFVTHSGLVYKSFSKDLHVIEGFVPPVDWEWYVSIDHGLNNPTAMLWHAVSPDNYVVTFSEHYASNMTVAEHAAVFHLRNTQFNRVPDIVVGDPAMHQRNAVTGTSIVQEYADNGVYVATEGVTRDVQTGINRITQYLRVRPDGKPGWQITSNCDALINEMLLLRWKTWQNRKLNYQNNKREEIHKKDDHACDSSRYFFTLLPDLTPESTAPVKKQRSVNAGHAAAVYGSWDELLAMQEPTSSVSQWSVSEYDDYSTL